MSNWWIKSSLFSFFFFFLSAEVRATLNFPAIAKFAALPIGNRRYEPFQTERRRL
jgi:hypothetical protein